MKTAKKQRELRIDDAVATMQNQNLAAGRTALLLKEFRQQQLHVYSANDFDIQLDRQMRVAKWYNRSAFRYNKIFKAPGAPLLQYFEESSVSGAEILALFARYTRHG
jgi:hypothetical protein